MATIADIVKLKSGYANFVELKTSFGEYQENIDRMAMYRPTTAHRKAFERLCRGLYKPTDKNSISSAVHTAQVSLISH